MHVVNLRSAMAYVESSVGKLTPGEHAEYKAMREARDSVIAFLSAPLPTCACGMFRAGQTFHNWHKTCPVNQSGEHAPVPRY